MRTVMRFRLRHLSGERHETAMNDAVSVAWENYRSLCMRGKDPEPFINKIAEYASRNVRSRLAAQTELPSLHVKENGAMSPAQLTPWPITGQPHRLTVQPLSWTSRSGSTVLSHWTGK